MAGLVGTVYGEACVLVAALARTKLGLDVLARYACPDVFRLAFNSL